MFAGKKSAQIREILISESAWEEMTCLFAPSLAMLAQLTPFCQTLVITGIDEDAARKKVLSLTAFAMQGNCWPAISPEALTDWFHSN